jgi:alkylhydroperoxidase/carboxymuconolactone decarboxylase family protein YurZ
MGAIATTLTNDQIATLKAGYSTQKMIDLLSAGMPLLDEDTKEYVTSIRDSFYGGSGTHMTVLDRERILIAVLASRDGGFNLALHIYIALMEGLMPAEIADVIFLSGIYTGVDRISDGLATELYTLMVLAQVAAPPRNGDMMEVKNALQAFFRPPPAPPTPKV